MGPIYSEILEQFFYGQHNVQLNNVVHMRVKDYKKLSPFQLIEVGLKLHYNGNVYYVSVGNDLIFFFSQHGTDTDILADLKEIQ